MHPKLKKQRRRLEAEPIPVDVECTECGAQETVDYNEVLAWGQVNGLLPAPVINRDQTRLDRRLIRDCLYELRKRKPSVLAEEMREAGFICPACHEKEATLT